MRRADRFAKNTGKMREKKRTGRKFVLWAVIFAAAAAAILAAVLAGGSKPQEEAPTSAEATATASAEARPFTTVSKPQASPTPTQTTGPVPPVQSGETAEEGEEAGRTGPVGSGSGSPDSGTEKTVSNPNTLAGGGGGSTGEAAHTHDWVEQTQTVHHEAEYEMVHHDAVMENIVVCLDCGEENPGRDHLKQHVANGENGGTAVKSAVVRAAYDEQVLVKDAWNETVVTGYRCSGCGAVK